MRRDQLPQLEFRICPLGRRVADAVPVEPVRCVPRPGVDEAPAA